LTKSMVVNNNISIRPVDISQTLLDITIYSILRSYAEQNE